MSKASLYIKLTKPGIIRANVFTAIAGYLVASAGSYDFVTLLGLIGGVVLVIAGGCVINNIEDRKRDALMDRTRKRALVTQEISPISALLFAMALLIVGFSLLAAYTNTVTVIIGIIGLCDYTIAYAYAKRKSRFGTLTGSVSGAVAMAAGYASVTSSIDSAFLLLVGGMILWQMAHFYAIGAYRKKDYARAGLYVIANSISFRQLRQRTTFFALGFGLVIILLQPVAELPFWYGLITASLTGWWLATIISSSPQDTSLWGKAVFIKSLAVLTGWCTTLGVAAHLM